MDPPQRRSPSRRIRAGAAVHKKRAPRATRVRKQAVDQEAMPAAKEKTTAGDDFDLYSYMHEVAENEKNVERSSSEIKAMSNLDVTQKHHRRQNRTIQSFLHGAGGVVDTNGNPKWGTMFEEVDNPNHIQLQTGSMEKVPRCFVALSGPITPQKRQLVNAICKDWQMRLKKTRFKDGECPWYAPGCQNAEFRAFLAVMARRHDWRYVESDFRHFEGCMNGAMKALYEERHEEWVSKYRRYRLRIQINMSTQEHFYTLNTGIKRLRNEK